MLSDFLAPDELGKRIWRASELGAVLSHQLSAPVAFDLGRLDAGLAKELRVASAAKGLLLRSFNDLFQHPCPPVELLSLVKDFAKRHLAHPASPLPPQIARVLYFVSISVALARCGRRITRLDDARLRSGIEWAMAQPWVGESTKGLLSQGLDALEESGEGRR